MHARLGNQPRRPRLRISLAFLRLAILEPSPRGAPVAPDSLGIGFRCFLPGASTAPPLRPLPPLVAPASPLVADALTLDATFPLAEILSFAAPLPFAPPFVVPAFLLMEPLAFLVKPAASRDDAAPLDAAP